jgi:hypothetical protein
MRHFKFSRRQTKKTAVDWDVACFSLVEMLTWPADGAASSSERFDKIPPDYTASDANLLRPTCRYFLGLCVFCISLRDGCDVCDGSKMFLKNI